MKKLIAISLLLLPLNIFGVLPPLYTSIDQIKSMLEDPDISSVFQSGESIEKIQRSYDGFEIYTNKSMVSVKMTILPQTMPGPEKFKFEFSRSRPRMVNSPK